MAVPELDDPGLRAWRDQTLYRLLLRASRAEAAATLDEIHQAGFGDVSLADTNLLSNLDTDGTTISALARRAGVSRQAASQQLATLQGRDYVECRASVDDRRAIVVRQTERGRELLRVALKAVEQLEQGYRTRLGPDRFAQVKEILDELVGSIDPTGRLGRS